MRHVVSVVAGFDKFFIVGNMLFLLLLVGVKLFLLLLVGDRLFLLLLVGDMLLLVSTNCVV